MFTSPIAALNRSLVVREIGCAEALEACLANIDRHEDVVRAWVVVDRDGARAEARRLDAELAEGCVRGPLHGVPIGVKDIIDVAGLPTGAGARHWADGPVAHDAPIVARLRDAGAIILGKTVTTPYAWIDPPPTANPIDPTRTPGGSSSGSAAAVASGMALAALGSQTGGSLTRPAAFCGIAALKPTYGVLSGAGVVPLAASLDHPGPLAASTADLGLVWSALCPGATAARAPTHPPRLGWLRGSFDRHAEPVQREALEAFLDTLRRAGARVEEVPLPASFDRAWTQHRVILASEAAGFHEDRQRSDPDDYPPRISRLIDEGNAVPATAYIFARNHQARLKAETLPIVAGFDALVTHAAPGPAPDRSTTGDPVMNSPWSYLGLPTISFPIGVTPEGLPLGGQLIGAPGGESALIGLGTWCEGRLRVCATTLRVRDDAPRSR
jgi:Asp-tRNA(Asn)/Glu-tRNA(Gln) amidotransferase A subunit family amidase